VSSSPFWCPDSIFALYCACTRPLVCYVTHFDDQHCDLQSASTEYFRKARCFLMDHGRLEQVPQFVINPEDTAFSNLTSTCTNTMALNLWPVYLSADIAMHAIAAAVAQDKERIAELQKAATGELAPIAPAASAELAAVDVPTSGPLTTTGMFLPIQDKQQISLPLCVCAAPAANRRFFLSALSRLDSCLCFVSNRLPITHTW
jgi:hypothetical protein